jgi:hypothetical protein
MKVLPFEAGQAVPPVVARVARGRRMGLVMMFLLSCGLTLVVATICVWHRDMIKGGGGFFSVGLLSMLGCLLMYLVAAVCAVMNCWHAVGGLVVACLYAWRGKVSRTGFWVMGAGYGLLSGLLLLDVTNEGLGPASLGLQFPIPRMVAVWVVPAVGALGALATRFVEPSEDSA